MRVWSKIDDFDEIWLRNFEINFRIENQSLNLLKYTVVLKQSLIYRGAI